MSRNVPTMTQCNLNPADLRGVGASLRTIYAVADDGKFDALLGKLDRAHARKGERRRG